MRSPARIDPMLDALREAWVQQPDARLGQLIYNAVCGIPMEVMLPPCPPLFYVEDDALLAALLGENDDSPLSP